MITHPVVFVLSILCALFGVLPSVFALAGKVRVLSLNGFLFWTAVQLTTATCGILYACGAFEGS